MEKHHPQVNKYGYGNNQDFMDPWHKVAVECVAGHFPNGHSTGTVVDTALRTATQPPRLGDSTSVRVAVTKTDVQPFGAHTFMSSLFLDVTGGPFGPRGMFASVSGYGETEVEAVVSGGCAWSCTFRALAQAACGLPVSESPHSLVDMPIVRDDGRKFRLVSDGWMRVMGKQDVDVMRQVGAQVARALGGAERVLAPTVAASSLLPVLARDRATLLSVFVMEMPHERIVEIKVDGEDHPPAATGLFRRDGESLSGDTMVLIRELAVLVPQL